MLPLCLFHSSAGKVEVMKFLITTGQADVNIRDTEDETPLHRACVYVIVATFLIDQLLTFLREA